MAAEKTGKVWHIYHYLELFRAREYKNPKRGDIPHVFYSQRPIFGKDQYTEQYLQQMDALKQTLRLEQFAMLKHVFEELLDHSQKHHFGNKYLRGYILNETFAPLDSKRIAAMVGCEKRAMDRYLSILEKVGLIERVDMPKLKSAEQLEKERKEEDAAEKGEVGNNVDAGAQNSTPLQESGKPLRVTGTGNTKKNNPTGKGEKEINPNPKDKGTDLQRQVEQMTNKTRTRNKPEPEEQTAASPPTTPKGENPNPNNPTNPDGGGIAKRIDRLCDNSGYAFALEVYRELEIQPSAESNAESELAAWQAAWQRALAAKLPPSKLAALWDKTIVGARRLCARKKRNGVFKKSAAAALMFEFNKRLRSYAAL